MPISLNTYQSLIQEIKSYSADLVAVSKTKTEKEIISVYNMGQRIFGENRAQELKDKQPNLPADIEWHMIGYLQSNKVKYIAEFVSLIHSVDRFSLLKEIQKQAIKAERVIPVLLQIHIAEEEVKHGFSFEELLDLFGMDKFKQFDHVRIRGIMGMATFTDNLDKVRSEFRFLKSCFDRIKKTFYDNDAGFDILSMGMSGDYKVALEEGATMVRIGSKIFGARET